MANHGLLFSSAGTALMVVARLKAMKAMLGFLRSEAEYENPSD